MYEFTPYIKENVEFFKKLSSTKSDQRKNDLLNQATADQILGLVEICANILRFNFELNNRQKRQLARYANYYRSIARSRTERTARKRLQQGSGIALGAILVPVLSVLAQHLLEKITSS
jgi:hypothetical protein